MGGRSTASTLLFIEYELLRTGQKEKEKAEKKRLPKKYSRGVGTKNRWTPAGERLQPLKPCRAGKKLIWTRTKKRNSSSPTRSLVAMLFRTDEDAPFFGACFCEDGRCGCRGWRATALLLMKRGRGRGVLCFPRRAIASMA